MAPSTAWISSPSTGDWTSVAIPRDTVVVQFKNDGPYDYWLHYGGVATPPYTPPNPQAQGQVFAGEYAVLPIQSRGQSVAEQRYNTIGDFDGNLWYYAVDNTGGLATTGTISSRNLIALICYGPLDPAPTAGTARPLWHDLASQPRVIAVPVTPAGAQSGTATFTAAGQEAGGLNSLDISPDTFDGSTELLVYLYNLHIVTVNATTLRFRIRLKFFDSGGVTLATSDTFLSQCTGTMPTVFTPAFPFPYPVTPPNTTQIVGAYLYAAGISANPTIADYNFAVDYDYRSGTNVPAIGGGLYGSLYIEGLAGGSRF
jgi:hypothetical protein